MYGNPHADRCKAVTDNPEPSLHHSLSNEIVALGEGKAKVLALGLYMDDYVCSLVFSLQILLILEPKGMIKRAL